MFRRKNDVSGKFNMFLNLGLLADAVLAIFGVFLLFMPNVTNKVAGTVIGVLLMFHAASMIYTYVSRDGAKLYSFNLIFGSLIALIGLILIVSPYTLMSFVTNCIGFFLIVTGASKINYAFWLRKGEEETWLITLTTGVLLIVISLIFMLNTFIVLALTQILGIFLICSSLINIMESVLFKKRSKEIVKIFW